MEQEDDVWSIKMKDGLYEEMKEAAGHIKAKHGFVWRERWKEGGVLCNSRQADGNGKKKKGGKKRKRRKKRIIYSI